MLFHLPVIGGVKIVGRARIIECHGSGSLFRDYVIAGWCKLTYTRNHSQHRPIRPVEMCIMAFVTFYRDPIGGQVIGIIARSWGIIEHEEPSDSVSDHTI